MTRRRLRARLKSRRALISLLVLLLLFMLVVSGGGHLGLFARVEISLADAGPTQVIGIEHGDSYRKLFKRVDEDLPGILELTGTGTPAALLSGPFARLPRHLSGAVVGVIVPEPLAEPLPAPLQTRRLPPRRVVAAHIRAHRSVAARKTYRKVRGYLATHDLTPSGDVLEIYHDDGIVELQVPVRNRSENDSEPPAEEAEEP